MDELKDDLLLILDNKIAEENQMVKDKKEDELAYSILTEEIKDAGICIKMIEDEDEEGLEVMRKNTTSNSICLSISNYFELQST